MPKLRYLLGCCLLLSVATAGPIPTSIGPTSFRTQRNSVAAASLRALYTFSNAQCGSGTLVQNVVVGSSFGGLATSASDSYLSGVSGASLSVECPQEAVSFGGAFTYDKSMNGIRLPGIKATSNTLKGAVSQTGNNADTLRDSSNVFSFEVWIKPDFSMSGGSYTTAGIAVDADFVILELADELTVGNLGGAAFVWRNCDEYGLRISIKGGSLDVSYCGSASGSPTRLNIEATPDLNANQLYQIVVTLDNNAATGGLKVYLDGNSLSTVPSAAVLVQGSFPFIFSSAHQVYVGSSPATLSTSGSVSTTLSFFGEISMVALYDTELSLANIASLKDESIANSAPVARDYTFNDLLEDENKIFSKNESSEFYYDEDFNLRPTLSPSDMSWRIPGGNLPEKGTLLLDSIDVATLSLPATGSVLEYSQNTPHQFSNAANDDFDFQICDPDDACSAIETMSVRINPVNDRPIAEPTSASVAEGATIPITLSYSDVDCNGNNVCSTTPGFVEPTTFFPFRAIITQQIQRAGDSPFLSGRFGTLYHYDYDAEECNSTEIETFPFQINPPVTSGVKPEFIVCYFASSVATATNAFEVGKDEITFRIQDGLDTSTNGVATVTVTNVLAVGDSPIGLVSTQYTAPEDTNATFQLSGTDSKCDGVSPEPAGCTGRIKRFKIIGLPSNAAVYHNGAQITSVPYPADCDVGVNEVNCIGSTDAIIVEPQRNFHNLAQYPQCDEVNRVGAYFRSKCVPGTGTLPSGIGQEVIPCSGTKCSEGTTYTMKDMNDITLGDCAGDSLYLGGCPEKLSYQLVVAGGASPLVQAQTFPGTVVWFTETNDVTRGVEVFDTLVIPSTVQFPIGNVSVLSDDGDNEVFEVQIELQSVGLAAKESTNIQFASLKFGRVGGGIFEDVRPCTFDCVDLSDGKQFQLDTETDCRNGCTSMRLTGILSAINFALRLLEYSHSDSSDVIKSDVIFFYYRQELATGTETVNAGQKITNGNEKAFVPKNNALGQAQLIAIITAGCAAVLMCCISICSRICTASDKLRKHTLHILARMGCWSQKVEEIRERERRDKAKRASADVNMLIARENAEDVWERRESVILGALCCCCGSFKQKDFAHSQYDNEMELSLAINERLAKDEEKLDLVEIHELMKWNINGSGQYTRGGITQSTRPTLSDGRELSDDEVFRWNFTPSPSGRLREYTNVETGQSVFHVPPIHLQNGSLIYKSLTKKKPTGPPPKPPGASKGSPPRGPPPRPTSTKRRYDPAPPPRRKPI